MSEPQRLLDEGGSDLEVSLLRSARDDGPSAVSRRKTLLALGLAGSAGAAVTTTTATTTAATVLGGSGGAVALAKWIAGGVVAGLLTVGVATVVQSSSADHVDEAARPTPRAPVAPPTANAVTRAPEAPPTTPDPPREEPSAAKAVPPAPSAVVKAPPSLTEEVASVDAARTALASGDTAGALRALDDHDRKFPGGMLGPEATVVRIEALVHRGDRASAVRLATAFLAAHPRSPHASHLRSLLGLPPPADAPP